MTAMQETTASLLGFLNPFVRQWGIDRRPPWKKVDRKLLDYLLIYVSEGTGEFQIDGRKWNIQADDLFWVPPDTLHTLEGYGPFMVCTYIHFDLKYERERSNWKWHIPSRTTDLGRWETFKHPSVRLPCILELFGRIRTRGNRRVGQLMGAVCNEADRGLPFAELKMSGLLVEALAELLQCYRLSKTPLALDARMEQVAEYISEHRDQHLTVSELARVSHLSPSNFRLRFRQYFACSPRDYLRRARILFARRLMSNGELTLTEIARQSGYETIHSFSRAFRKVEGLSPSEYRRSTCDFGPLERT